MKIKLLLIMLALAILTLISAISFACADTTLKLIHGYIDFPASRAYLYSLSKNGNSGAVIVELQSVEGCKGFPRKGPPDGKITSVGHRWFDELDDQSDIRWTKVDISPGKNTFHWTLTVPHRTTG
ncbi:MAG TPA: lytic polysaccharide monooxygenase [Arsenophonus sp.]